MLRKIATTLLVLCTLPLNLYAEGWKEVDVTKGHDEHFKCDIRLYNPNTGTTFYPKGIRNESVFFSVDNQDLLSGLWDGFRGYDPNLSSEEQRKNQQVSSFLNTLLFKLFATTEGAPYPHSTYLELNFSDPEDGGSDLGLIIGYYGLDLDMPEGFKGYTRGDGGELSAKLYLPTMGSFVAQTRCDSSASVINGDVDRNGCVNIKDAYVWYSNLLIRDATGTNSFGATSLEGDLDDNGILDFDDLSVIAANFGKGCNR